MRRVTSARAPDAATRAFWWFAAALTCSLVLLHSGFDNTEGIDHARTAIHWLKDGRLGQAERPSAVFVQGRDGLFYPAHELGSVLWQLPAAAAALAVERVLPPMGPADSPASVPEIVMAFGSLLVSLVTAAGFWKWLEWGFAAPVRVRLAGSATLIFATMLLPYSRMLTDVCATGAWLTWGAALGARAASTGGAWPAAGAGAALGFALLTRIPSLVAAAPLFAVMLARTRPARRRQVGAAAVAGALPMLAALLWFNDLRTGSPFVPALMLPEFAVVRMGTGHVVEGVTGLLASPGKSIFVFSPVLLLSVVGWRRLYRAAPADALGVAAACTAFVLVHGTLGSWHADWGWGPRHFTFMIPIAWLPGALFIASLPAGTARHRLAAALVAASVALQGAAMTINWHYQYQLMSVEGRLDGQTPWRADNQMTDMLRASGAGIARAMGVMPPAPPAIAGITPLTHAASTGINVWWITALRAGLPPLAVWPAVLLIAAAAAAAWRRAAWWARPARDQ